MDQIKSDSDRAFLLARIAIGMSMFGHGVVRLPKLTAFSDGMVEQFTGSMLPAFMVVPFSYLLPVAELITGILLLIGLFTREALIAGGFIMVALIFGTSMVENWGALPSQLIHTAFFCVLLRYVSEHNMAAADHWFRKH